MKNPSTAPAATPTIYLFAILFICIVWSALHGCSAAINQSQPHNGYGGATINQKQFDKYIRQADEDAAKDSK